jgi:ABC-type glycerol-3-phosphate transport system permease component
MTRPGTRRALARAAVMVPVAVALAVTLAPVYWMVSTSFKDPLEAASLNPTLWPRALTGGNYRGLFGESLPFGTFFVNSIVTALAAAVVSVAIATLAGYSFSRVRYRLRGTVSVIVLATQMLPLVVLIGPLYLLLLKAGLLDTYLGLIIGYTSFTLPFAAWLMKGFIDAIPPEVEEAARVDGYSRLGILVRIVVPLSVPGLVTTAVFVFMNAWNNLLYPLTLTSSDSRLTLPPGLLQSFSGQFKTDWGGMMAAACLTSIPLIIAFLAVQRSMVRGMTSGALGAT